MPNPAAIVIGAGDATGGAIARAFAEDRWPEVRRRAVTALGARCRRPLAAQALGEAVDEDPDLGVRGDALSALVRGTLGDPKLGLHNGLPVTVIVLHAMHC